MWIYHPSGEDRTGSLALSKVGLDSRRTQLSHQTFRLLML